MIDWNGSENVVLLNPRLPDEVQRRYRKIVAAQSLTHHVWLTTSGTASAKKLVGLSKRAILASAASVNRHFGSTRHDHWIVALPTFHIGGLSILARAFLSGARVSFFPEENFLPSWNPQSFCGFCQKQEGTLVSLVPAQVYDLVESHCNAPRSLRAVIVGGGELPSCLYSQARERGWPLLPSYGLTECASQVATASLASLSYDFFPTLSLLDHVEVALNAEGRLKIKSDALFSGMLVESSGEMTFENSVEDGWFLTDDIVTLGEACITSIRRLFDVMKVGGETVDLAAVGKVLEDIRHKNFPDADAALFSLPDDRLGTAIYLAVAHLNQREAGKLYEIYNANVLPFERARTFRLLDAIPRTPLGKVVMEELKSMGQCLR